MVDTSKNTGIDPISGNVVPLANELPAPTDRVYYNEKEEKPVRKLKTLDVKFGELTE
eukprot:CAMPEP_0176351056 /NCGR_PEP_ID=MMETSP0126-20121128/9942_1 /TAXON_ID=141414 ORGANISM="Strombidinopsis acuminatum, Strain SPMC142" /NCGR_SAMPLE_ID=MMETSP0126 /ASSEMBLY_ACC=CAM_ASM_000229 /LENGTH=56 /DNA_ID=CAMNT_0017701383 /DNA_START=16 /DNA_END=186 /DNA_ORIENTATION=+